MTVKSFKKIIAICSVAIMMGMQTTCQAWPSWTEAWGVCCTIAGVGSAEVPPVGAALIGVQAGIFSGASIEANSNTGGNPEINPTEFSGSGPAQPSAAVVDAMLALIPPDVTPSGTPAEIQFIQKCNVILGLSRVLQGETNSAVIKSNLTQISIALENAAVAYDETGLNQAITQSDIDAFETNCASGTGPAPENDYLTACGLTPDQLLALTLHFSTEPLILSTPPLSVSTMLHRAAQLLNPNAVIYAGMQNVPLNNAILIQNLQTNLLTVSFIGTQGQDGVEIIMPSNLRGMDVSWQSLDLSNTLPVGAYVQEQITGTVNGVIDNLWGMLTVTKAGTSNYVISVDYSPVGASTYTVQAYHNGVLVAQATNQSGTSLATAASCCGSFDWEFWPGWGPTVDWNNGGTPLFLAGASTAVMCDRLYIIPENVPMTNVPAAMQIKAYQVPALTITSENTSLVYQGLTNTSLGNATLEIITSLGSSGADGFVKLHVSNIGSSGQDGVSIALHPGNNFAGNWQNLDPSNALPVGAYIKSQMIGITGTTNGVLGSTLCTKSGTSNYLISVDYSPLGSSTHTVQVYNGTKLVTQLTGQAGSACATVKLPPWICTINPWLNNEWPSPTLITIVGGPTVLGTEILMIPEGAAAVSSISAEQIMAAGIPSITITNESESVTYAGLTHTALGNATLGVSGTSLYVSNLGSSGQDGVSIALPNGIQWASAWNSLEQGGSALPDGAYLQMQLVGTANGVTNGVLGTTTATESNSTCVVSCDLSPLGASNLTVRVYNGTNLVGQVAGLSMGPVFSDPRFPGDCSTCTSCYPDWTFDDPQNFLITGSGQVFTGNRVLIVAQGGVTGATASTVNLLASQIPTITVTNTVVSPLAMTLVASKTNLTLQWFGTGSPQQSSNLKTWSDITNVVSPFVTPIGTGNKFYRIKQPMGNENF